MKTCSPKQLFESSADTKDYDVRYCYGCGVDRVFDRFIHTDGTVDIHLSCNVCGAL